MPPDAKIISSTCATNKKSDGIHRAILNARGFEPEYGVHYTKDDFSAPVVNDINIRIVLILMIMAAWWEELLDFKGAFLA